MPDHRPTFLPLDGSMTLMDTLDFHLDHNPNLPAFVYSTGGEVTTISFLEFIRACHRAAYSLSPTYVVSGRPVVAVMALADTISYQAVVVGLMKAGLVPFLLSPRNSASTVVHLLKKMSCHRLITTRETLRPFLESIAFELKERDGDFLLSIEEIPSLHELFPKLGSETAEDRFAPYPQAQHSLQDVAVYLHSSGSTGLPKVIPWTHELLVNFAAFPMITQLRELKLRVCGIALPPFHTYGFLIQVASTLFGSITVSTFPPTVLGPGDLPMPATSDNILDHVVQTKSNILMTVPTFLKIWSESLTAVETLKSLDLIIFGGGPLPQAIGDSLVSSGVKLRSGYGGTEFEVPGYPILKPGDEKEWQWIRFNERVNVRWVPQSNGVYECQFLTCDTHALTIENLPDVKGYATSDLWERHLPRIICGGCNVGRLDDVIIHSTGEKTMPGPIELTISQSPIVHAAIVFGHGYDQTGILVQPNIEYTIDTEDVNQLSDLRNKLWPVIDDANQVAPACSKIFKEMILITSTNKPLARSPKGGVLRQASISLYEAEIQQLYKTVEANSSIDSVGPPKSWSTLDVQQWLLEQAQDILPGTSFSSSIDLFRQGFDSLSATILRLRLISTVQSSQSVHAGKVTQSFGQNIVYTYPTIDRLAAFVSGFVADPEQQVAHGQSHEALINEMIQKYSVDLDIPLPGVKRESRDKSRAVVLLTGSTGTLGSELLASLLRHPDVEKVYTVNRPSSKSVIHDRHKTRFEDKGLDITMLQSTKLVHLETDISELCLGLSGDVYGQLQDSVTVIIHNSWQLDFNLQLGSFETHIRGTRNLIDLARSSKNASSIRFLFTSSITSAQSWESSLGPYPERVIDDPKYAVGGGYGEGKYVAERILSHSGLTATSFRIGQISGGPPSGSWSTTEWVPILVKSSVALGILPDLGQAVAWIPINTVSDAILEVAFSEKNPPLALNIVHPRPVPWISIMKDIQRAVKQHKKLSDGALAIVSFSEWFSKVDECAKRVTEETVNEIPAIKLVEFYRNLLFTTEAGLDITQFDTTIAQSFSQTLRNLAQLGFDDVDLWVSYWTRHGL